MFFVGKGAMSGEVTQAAKKNEKPDRFDVGSGREVHICEIPVHHKNSKNENPGNQNAILAAQGFARRSWTKPRKVGHKTGDCCEYKNPVNSLCKILIKAKEIARNRENQENRLEIKQPTDESFAWLDDDLEKENQERGENEAGNPQIDVILKRVRDVEDGLDDRLAREQPQSVEDSNGAEREQGKIARFATEKEQGHGCNTDHEDEEAEGKLCDLHPQVGDREGQGRNSKKQGRERHAGEFIRGGQHQGK